MVMLSAAPDRKWYGLGRWMDKVPLPWIDQFFVLTNLTLLALVTAVVSRYEADHTWPFAIRSQPLVDPAVMLPAFIFYEAVISAYIWWKKPLASGQEGWFLFVTLAFAALFYGITGGVGSIFYYPLALVIIYAALALRPVAAAICILGVAALHSIIGPMSTPSANWSAELARVAMGESTVLLLLGSVVLYFSTQLRRDARAYQSALVEIRRNALLNQISLHLAEHGLDLAELLDAIMEAAQLLPETEFALVMLLNGPDSSPRVAASSTEKHRVGEVASNLTLPVGYRRVSGVGSGYSEPLPPYFAGDGVRQVIFLSLRLPSGEMLGAVCVGRQSDIALTQDEILFAQDLSDEAELAVRNARLYARELEQVERLRAFQELQTTYFSALAHEMKTPLTVLRTLVPSLRRLSDLPDETRNEIFEAIDGNLARLEWSINGPLEGARLEAGVIVFHPGPLDLAGSVRQVVARIGPWLALKRQQVCITAPPDLPPVLVDSSQIDQVITNLLVNAIKFSPAGSTIGVTLQPGETTMQVWVEDEGPGVPPEARERIFDKFHSVAAAQASAGAGLGLYICREVVTRHGGRIWVEDRPGGGSRFCFTVPLVQDANA